MQLVTAHSFQRPKFHLRPVHVGYVVVAVALGNLFCYVLQFSPNCSTYQCYIISATNSIK